MNTERTHRGLLALIGLLRCAIGVAGIAQPARLGRLTGFDRVTAERTAFLSGMAAARDLALGLGQIVAATRRDPGGAGLGGDARLWAFAGALADAGDVAALSGAAAHGRIAPLRGYLLAGSAVAGVLAAAPVVAHRRRGLPGE